MFQYAAVKGVARHKGYEFTVPKDAPAIRDNLGNILKIELFDVFDLQPDSIAFLQANSL
jgi:hypothetical protein